MHNFAVLLKYEWKKIVSGRIAVPALLLCAAMLAGSGLLGYLVTGREDAHIYDQEAALEGRPIDDNFLQELAVEAEQAGGLAQIGPESLYYHAAGYIRRLQGAALTVGEPSAAVAGSAAGGAEAAGAGLSAEALYRLREEFLEYYYGYFRLSGRDRDWWREREEKIGKPFVWQANFGISRMRSNYGAVMDLFCILAAVSLAGVYAGEKTRKTDALLLCSKEGRHRLWLVKAAAGELFALMAGAVLLAAAQLPHLLFNGLHGARAPWQLIVPFSSYPYSAGHMLLVMTAAYFLGCLAVGALVLLLSLVTGNALASAGTVCAAVMADLFVNLSPELGFLSQLRYLTPGQVLINSSMADPRLLHVFGQALTSYQSAGILYMLVTALALLAVRGLYRRRKAG